MTQEIKDDQRFADDLMTSKLWMGKQGQQKIAGNSWSNS
jgi:hypothetical protein